MGKAGKAAKAAAVRASKKGGGGNLQLAGGALVAVAFAVGIGLYVQQNQSPPEPPTTLASDLPRKADRPRKASKQQPQDPAEAAA